MNRIFSKWDLRFLELSRLVSHWSKDPSTQVGAVIVRSDNTVASLGFNGFPRGMDDKEEWLQNRDEKYSRIVHGEINAILFAKESLKNYTLYTYPFMPCDRCFVQVVQSGITRVVAPKATEEQLVRWGMAFERVRKYAVETGVTLIEVDL